MSANERERSHLVRQCVEGRLGQREASERLGIGLRQFKRLVRSWRQDGDAGLVSRQRGRPSNRRLNDVRRAEIAVLLKGRYSGFGATLASEKLLELDGIKVSTETVRQMLISLGEFSLTWERSDSYLRQRSLFLASQTLHQMPHRSGHQTQPEKH